MLLTHRSKSMQLAQHLLYATIFFASSSATAMAQSSSSNTVYQPQRTASPQPAPSQRPSPFFKPAVIDKHAYSTTTLTKMPEFKTLPPFPQKYRLLSAAEFPGGSPCSATFEVAQPLHAVLTWYEDSLKLRGWQVQKRDLGFSAHITATLARNGRIDIQLLSVKSRGNHTRVFAKEFTHLERELDRIGGKLTADQLPTIR